MASEYDCLSRSFARACREADRERRKQEKQKGYSPKSALHWLSAPQVTLEALLYDLRARGALALTDSSNHSRLAALDDKQFSEVVQRLGKKCPACPNGVAVDVVAAVIAKQKELKDERRTRP